MSTPVRFWRQGRKVGNTIYAMQGPEPSDDDVLIGVMFTPEQSEDAVQSHNVRLLMLGYARGQ